MFAVAKKQRKWLFGDYNINPFAKNLIEKVEFFVNFIAKNEKNANLCVLFCLQGFARHKNLHKNLGQKTLKKHTML